MKFQGSGDIYDGGQNAQLNQEFAQHYAKAYICHTVVRIILALGVIGYELVYDWKKDPWKDDSAHNPETMDSKYARIELFSIIYASLQIVYTIIQSIVIRSWSKKRANFVGK